MSTKPSPTPWRVAHYPEDAFPSVMSGRKLLVCSMVDEANAALIVRAVNNCERIEMQNRALIEALKSVRLVLQYTDYRVGLSYASALNIEGIVNAALEQEAQ